jgi:hypothetical protein
MFKEIFSLFYVLVFNIFFKYVPLQAQAPDTALVFRRREGVNPRHVIQNFFLLKLVTLTIGLPVRLQLQDLTV